MTTLERIRSLKRIFQDSTYLKSEACVNKLDEPESTCTVKPEHQTKDTNERVKGEPQI